MDKITKEQVKNFPLDNERARISLIDGEISLNKETSIF